MKRIDAEESVAAQFTRAMNASASPLGKFSDLVSASVLSGILLVVGLYVVRRSTGMGPVYGVLVIAALPAAISWLIALSLRRTREHVIAWLESVPFDVVNLNALLAGVADRVEVALAPGAPLPTRAALQPELERVHEDVLLLKSDPEQRTMEIQLGVIDVKRLPFLRQHERWRRFVQVVEQVLVPLASRAPITSLTVL